MSNNLSRRQIIKVASSFVAGTVAAGSTPLISKLANNLNIISPANAQAIFKPGAKIYFKCLGHIPGSRYLNGITTIGRVDLVNDYRDYTGAKWEVGRDGSGRYYTFKCLGHIPGNRYLNGITQARYNEYSVDLTPTYTGRFTGARWSLIHTPEASYASYALRCEGAVQTGQEYLNGRTTIGEVDLVNSYTAFTGTKWEIGFV